MRRIAWGKMSIIFLIFGFLTWHPISRGVIWFVLPLGTKPDDLLVLVLMFFGIGILIAGIRGAVNLDAMFRIVRSLFTKERKRKNDEYFYDEHE